jgi:hypothetical protein
MDNRERDRDSDADDRMDLESPLGLSGEPVPKDDLIKASDDEESVRRRRARAGLGHGVEERRSNGLGDINTDPDGAAGIDMGYGGEGTDLKPSR